METENTKSEIEAYVIDFFDHLNSVQKCKKQFMIFYPHWEKLRLTTIRSLKELQKDLKLSENVADGGTAFGAATGIAGFMGIIAYIFSAVISPLLAVITFVGHVFKLSFATAKASAVSSAKEKVKNLVKRDYEETRVFLKLGLAYDGVIQEMKDTVENIHRMSWSYSEEQLEKEINRAVSLVAESRNDHLSTNEKVAQSVKHVAKFVGQIDIKNVAGIVGKSLENNPEAKSAVRSLLQAVPNAIGLTRLMENETISGLSRRTVYFLTGIPSLQEDCQDVAKCINNLVTGASVTQDTIRSVLDRLKEQHQWLKDIHTRLSQVDLTSRTDFPAEALRKRDSQFASLPSTSG